MSERTLVLNTSYQPLSIVPWEKALCLVFGGRAELVSLYDREVLHPSISVHVPAIVRLKNQYRVNYRGTFPFSRGNIYQRDRDTCQYCGMKMFRRDLTLDHVKPRACGGERSWENLVTCCGPCNNRKGNRTPEEAHMKLIRAPRRMTWKDVPLDHESWGTYL